jgi:hypothetical protein
VIRILITVLILTILLVALLLIARGRHEAREEVIRRVLITVSQVRLCKGRDSRDIKELPDGGMERGTV